LAAVKIAPLPRAAGLCTEILDSCSTVLSRPSARGLEDCEQVADLLLTRERVVQRQFRLDRVAVAPAGALTRDVARIDELDHDAMCGPFGYPDGIPDLAQTGTWVVRDMQEHLGVVREERPRRWFFVCDIARLAFLDSYVMLFIRMAPNEGGPMPRFKCMSCSAGFYSAAGLADLNDQTCSDCGSLLEPADTPGARQVLDDRLGRLIARREVVRAQVRFDSERWADDGGRTGAAV
jgi:hypothetical protein